MKKTKLSASFCGAMLAFCLIALPAYAQATRTWVWSRRRRQSLQPHGALQELRGGDLEDGYERRNQLPRSGGFGAVTITKSIIISCEGVTAGVLVQAPMGSSSMSREQYRLSAWPRYPRRHDRPSGIHFIQAGILHVEHCLIRGFNAGMRPASTSRRRVPASLCVECYITDNGTGANGAGILIRPTGTGSANVVLNQIYVENNAQGVKVDITGGTSAVNLNFVDSVSAGNTNFNVGAFTTRVTEPPM